MVFVIVGFWSVALLMALVAGQSLVMERRDVYRTMRSLDSYSGGRVGLRQRDLARSFVERALVPGFLRIGGVARAFAPAALVERIRRDLVLAGSPEGWDAERLLGAKLLSGVAGLASGAGLSMLLGASPPKIVLVTLVIAALAFFVPDYLVRRRAAKRQSAIRKALPDALDLLAISAEAGLGFDAGIARLVAESGGPLSDEFNRMLREMQLGTSRATALRAMADRTSVDELKSFVLAMVQADTFGVSIANVLQIEAHELRTKRRQRAEEKAQKIPVKMVGPLILCIFPALFVVLLGPAALNIYRALIK